MSERTREILDEVRCMIARRLSPEDIERWLERQHGIEPMTPCQGEAHGNPYIDNCHTCAPRWGWLGEKVP